MKPFRWAKPAALLAAMLVLMVVLAISQTATSQANQQLPESLEGQTTVEALAELLAGSSEQVREGAQLYDDNCSACHGDTALGIREARLSFPPEERRCTRCHRRQNPPQMALEQMTYNYAFSIGEPPPLRGEGHGLAKFGNGLALHSFLAAAMPRQAPGSLAPEEYLKITAFLLELTGTRLGDTVLTLENAASFPVMTAPEEPEADGSNLEETGASAP